MSKQEIEKILKDNWIRRGEGWRMYEAGKRLLTSDNLSPSEYESRIKTLSD
jgi:hypothetical protein